MKHVVEFSGTSNMAVPCVEVATRAQIQQCAQWKNSLREQAKDRRYYELVEDTIHDEFDYRYFVIRDRDGEISAVQPFFILDQDLLVGASPRFGRVAGLIRRVWPRFMFARTLMVGCAAGEGHLDGTEASSRGSAAVLASAVVKEARKLKARLIVLKEFPAKYRQILECFVGKGFTRIPSMPNVMLNINYPSFEEYMKRALSSGARRKLRLKLRATEQAPPIEMSVVDDVTPIIDDIYPLYLQVYHRSGLHFEKLTPAYFCGLGTRLGDKNRFFVWRQGGKIVAFGCCLVQGDMIHAEYLGMDYSIALDLHLYHYTFRDLINWSIANGYKWFHSSALNYDPKFHLRYKLYPIDLYVRHTSPAFNVILRQILPWLEPTRYDDTLPMFDNYQEIWAADARSEKSLATKARAALATCGQAFTLAFEKLPFWLSACAEGVSALLETGWGKLVASGAAVASCTLGLLAVDQYFATPALMFCYLAPIVLMGARFGRTTTLSTAILSALCAAFFFVEPRFGLDISGGDDLTVWLFFCTVALLVSQVPIKQLFGSRRHRDDGAARVR